MPSFVLSRPFLHHEGHCWIASIPKEGDTLNASESELILYEGNNSLEPAHTTHADIARDGIGFSHWDNHIYFSPKDKGDPNFNGLEYIAKFPDFESESVDKRNKLRQSKGAITPELIEKFLSLTSLDSTYEVYHLADKFSMLHEDVLAIYELIAARTNGRILEVGSYIGGGTAALAKYSKHPVVVIEGGGAYLEHEHLPTPDIIEDFRRTLTKFNLKQNVELIPAFSNHPETMEWLGFKLQGKKIDTLVIDADGQLERDLRILAPRLAKNCLMSIDDYKCEVKRFFVKPVIDALVKAKQIEEYGVYGFGTWVGRANGPIDLDKVTITPLRE